MTALTLKLAQLRSGRDPLAGQAINARAHGKLDGLHELATSLGTHGQLVRLLVVLNPTGKKEGEGLYFVVDGDRRLAAMQKYWQHDAPVLVEVAPTDRDALEMSIAANSALPMHPVDRYRGYAEVMKREKIDSEQLARRFGVASREMRKSLALAALADPVLDAWLAGELSADQAGAFTLQPDKKDQGRILEAARKQGPWSLEPAAIRNKILGKRKDASPFVAFVGVEAYRKAGGKVVEDLFSNKHAAANPALATKLARDKIEAIGADLVKAGWSWALAYDKVPDGWDHGVSGFTRAPAPKTPPFTDAEKEQRDVLAARVKLIDDLDDADWDEQQEAKKALEAFDSVARARGYPKATMARSGCVLSITDAGTLRIDAGVIKPADKAAAKTNDKAKPAKKEPAKPAQISSALAIELSDALTRAAAATVLEAKDHLLNARLIAGALETPSNYGVRLRNEGEGMGTDSDKADNELKTVLVPLRKMNAEDLLLGPLAHHLASSIWLRNGSPTRMLVGKTDDVEDEDVTALLEELPGKILQSRLRKEFDPVDYFTKAPGAMAHAALAEMGVSSDKSAKKSTLAAAAAEEARQTGWLPWQLRTSTYEGPQAKPVKAAPRSAKKKGS